MEHELLPPKKLTELSAKVKQVHGLFVNGQAKMLEHAVAVGHTLREAKAGLRHGAFGAWVESNCEIAYRTARVYMNIAQKHDRGLITPLMLTNTTLKKALEAQVGEEGEPRPKPKKVKKAPEPVPAKAAHGKPKPSDVKTAIETGRVMFKPLLDEIQRLRHAVKRVSGTRLCGEYLPLGEVDKGLRNVQSALKYATPHSRCCWCARAGGLQEGCNSCKGRGWISKGLYEMADERLKRMVKGGGS